MTDTLAVLEVQQYNNRTIIPTVLQRLGLEYNAQLPTGKNLIHVQNTCDYCNDNAITDHKLSVNKCLIF